MAWFDQSRRKRAGGEGEIMNISRISQLYHEKTIEVICGLTRRSLTASLGSSGPMMISCFFPSLSLKLMEKTWRPFLITGATTRRDGTVHDQ